MLSTLFKKEINNNTFLFELRRNNVNEKWLEEALLDEMIDINHKDENKDTFLMLCIKESQTKSALWLLNHNADVSLQNKEYKTALFLAVEKKNMQIIDKIIDNKLVNLNQRDFEGRTLLQNIILNGHNDIAKILINHGVNCNNLDNKNRNIMYDCLSYGDKSFIRYILKNVQVDLNVIDDDGNSIMHHTEVVHNDEIAKQLLNAGANSTLQNKKGESYLFNVALKMIQAEEIIDIALENGADVNASTSNGNTILTDILSLSSKGNGKKDSLLRISKKMISHGGNINAIENNNESALFKAIRSKDYELAEFLLIRGINPNIINRSGLTVLNIIIYEGFEEIECIQLLLKYGANPNIKDKDGKTIYELLNIFALHNYGTNSITDAVLLKKINPCGEYIKVLKVLLNNKKNTDDLNYLDSTGDPLFFKPLLYNHFELFKLYIKNGLDLNLINKSNHNIFFEYVFKIFNDNNVNSKICENFQNTISFLISNKVAINYQDKLGATILHKLMATKCNVVLYDILIKIILFNYSIVDFQGRSVVHNAVWSNQIAIVKKIYLSNASSINITDNYELLPISYAALLGNKELVLLLLELGSNISGSKPITAGAIKKFSPMLKNLRKLKKDITDKSQLKNIDILIEQIIRDFRLI